MAASGFDGPIFKEGQVLVADIEQAIKTRLASRSQSLKAQRRYSRMFESGDRQSVPGEGTLEPLVHQLEQSDVLVWAAVVSKQQLLAKIGIDAKVWHVKGNTQAGKGLTWSTDNEQLNPDPSWDSRLHRDKVWAEGIRLRSTVSISSVSTEDSGLVLAPAAGTTVYPKASDLTARTPVALDIDTASGKVEGARVVGHKTVKVADVSSLTDGSFSVMAFKAVFFDTATRHSRPFAQVPALKGKPSPRLLVNTTFYLDPSAELSAAKLPCFVGTPNMMPRIEAIEPYDLPSNATYRRSI